MDNSKTIRANLDESIVKNFFNENDFFLTYQRKVSLVDNSETVGLEAFLRLRQEDKTVFSPAAFLPVVERMGLIPELTELLITQVTKDWDLLSLMGLEQTVAVNIDTSVFADPEVMSRLIGIIKESNMPPSKLSIDIIIGQETVLSPEAITGLERLRMLGANLSLDIVSGSQLNTKQIENLPIDEIKIGRTLICNIFEANSSKSIIKDYLDLSRRMGLSISAIGIENNDEVDWLTNYGVDFGQGYLFGQPVEIDQLPNQESRNIVDAENDENFRLKVLIVEDDVEYGNLMVDLLSEHYEIFLTNNETDALEIFSHDKPEILLLDVNLKDSYGFNIANSINENNDESEYSIIFVSGDNSQENQIKSYESGGVAFIPKPISIVDLVTRINRVAALHKKRKETYKKIKDTESMAFQSMREASHYGDIVQFMKEISIGSDEPSISRALFKYMGNRGLSCSIVFRDKEHTCSFDHQELSCCPTELNVFELLHDKGRLYEFGHRLMVNDHHISFLVKNMPTDEVEKGQARDYVAVLIECMESRYMSILQNRVLAEVVNDLSDLTQEAITSIENANKNKLSMIDKFSEDIALSFHILDLNDEQEQHLKNIIDGMLNAKEHDEISTDDIVDRISAATNLLSATLAEIKVAESETLEDESCDAIELF
jgi:EAL domain-containing protein (putative c-di-GMP-specific phosphodiesterase class I)/DNA-binding response OmpR family regulator